MDDKKMDKIVKTLAEKTSKELIAISDKEKIDLNTLWLWFHCDLEEMLKREYIKEQQ